MNREQRLTMADAAVERAAKLARDAERNATDYPHRATPLAAAGALWADIARAHAAIAATLPADTTTED